MELWKLWVVCTRAFHARECSSLCCVQQAVAVLPSEASPVQRSRAGSSGDFGRPSRAERARARMSSAPAEPSGFEAGNVDTCDVFRAARPGNFERPGGAERVRTAMSSAPAEPSGLERPFRAPQRSRAGSMSDPRNLTRCKQIHAIPLFFSPAWFPFLFC